MPGDGKLEMTFTPKDGGEPIRRVVFEFEGTGGVALAMYNTDRVGSSFLHFVLVTDLFINKHQLDVHM